MPMLKENWNAENLNFSVHLLNYISYSALSGQPNTLIVSLALVVQLYTAHVFNIIAIFPHNKYYAYKKDICIKNETEISLIYIYFIPVICI